VSNHAMPDEAGSSHVRLTIYARSLGRDTSGQEHKSLLDAKDAAVVSGDVTWLDNSAGAPVAAIVPRGIAELGIRAWAEWEKTGKLPEEL
jgi:hypothetical protein